MDDSDLEVRSVASCSAKSKSTRSSCSKASVTSNASMVAAKARAKAEAALARASFSKKEIEIKTEKARLEATLEALEREREAEAALATAAVMEAVAVKFESESQGLAEFLPEQSTRQRTEEYVSKYSANGRSMNLPRAIPSQNTGNANIDAPNLPGDQGSDKKSPLLGHPMNSIPADNADANHYNSFNSRSRHAMDTPASIPNSGQPGRYLVSPARRCGDNSSTDLAKYLARSQLVSSGLIRFDDRPENYLAWKSSFIGNIETLDLTAGEEMDLLIKWLGKDSAQHAQRIKSVNVRNPSAGLNAIWQRLEDMYGSPEAIEGALFVKLETFPKIAPKEHQKLMELSDLLSEVEFAKREGYLTGLSYLDTARGVNPIVEKLPYGLQEKWMMKGSHYKQEHKVAFPPFSFFVQFLHSQAKARNDPSFHFNSSSVSLNKRDRFGESQSNARKIVSVHKIDVISSSKSTRIAESPDKLCPVHHKPHPLQKCRGFREMTLEERKRILKVHNICFKCCASNTHVARNCEATVQCFECKSYRHPSALHPGQAPWLFKPPLSFVQHGGEKEEISEAEVSPKCTEVCGEGFKGKSCSKICLAKVYPEDDPSKCRRMYVMLDDQSNRSLARSEFFDMFSIHGPTVPFTLRTCAGVAETAGRRAVGFIIEPVDSTLSIPLPTLLECNMIPDNRDEIPTPAAAASHRHLKSIVHEIPSLDANAEILLLLGRDLLRVHKVRRQLSGPNDAAFAQKLDLGWVIVGDVCLGNTHRPSQITSMKTYVLESGRPSHFSPCESHLSVKEKFVPPLPHLSFGRSLCENHLKGIIADTGTIRMQGDIGQSVFCQTKDDNELALSAEDRRFLTTMEKEFSQDSTNSWVAPLPFREQRQCLPNNRSYAMSRFKSLSRTLEKRPEMKVHFMEFMQKILDSHHAEIAPPVQEGKEYWYLPFFGVYHPQKPNQIRVVFDSSAKFSGVSLNDVLLSGPDMNNSLLGVLLRFRKNPVAITADIQQMFHCFLVREDCRDVLRFLWYRDNDPAKEVVDYRMRVHVFGNSPSPAVAIFGLHRVAREGEDEYGREVRHFVERDFYMDDALKSFSTVGEAIDILSRTQTMLAASNLKLHKMASNNPEVLDAFPVEDRAKDLQNLDLFVDELPDQRSLGVRWSIMSDVLTFHIPRIDRPYTRRGVLSMVNSLFDPLGFLSPITIQGRLLLREMTSQVCDWDSSLPENLKEKWIDWQNSLYSLTDIRVPRTYSASPLSKAQGVDLFVFSDASVKAISSVAYLRVTTKVGSREVGFVLGKSKLAPHPDLTIPRLELCAAVMAAEIAEVISEEIDIKFNSVSFYTDSKVVLGYINNQSRRFYVYVNNRVQRIRQTTKPDQWHYVPSEENPADHGSRSVSASKLLTTTWLTGPAFLYGSSAPMSDEQIRFELIDPDDDKEIRPEVKTLSTCVSENSQSSKRWERFSRWKTVVKAVAHLTHIAYCFARSTEVGDCAGWHICKKGISVDSLERAEKVIIRNVQQEVYSEEFKCIQANRNLSKQSPLLKLNPTIGSDGLLRVGGRIHHAGLELKESHPVIIPGKNHIATLIVRYYHENVQHQGRHFTEGAMRAGGLWLIGGKRLTSKVLNQCVSCKKLRGKVKEQQMCDLPAERLQVDPPFSYVGMDMFGPWEVSARRTRGGHVNSKRWAVLFTCLCTRAVHIEVVEEMSSSSFINALRRFFSLRGPAKQLRSDCGTNFIGACKEMGISCTEEDGVQDYLQDQRCTWVFNPPHSSHMGGVWERMIGVARRILDGMLLQTSRARLTHEVLTTLLAEVTAIMNARPLIPVSSDPENPCILTPSMLLTQKSGTYSSPDIDINGGDMLKYQWKRVQLLADEFWYRWCKEYLCTLQCRQKWTRKELNIKEGDVVLLKDDQVRRNEWPMGIIMKAVPSKDGMIRKVEVKVVKQGLTKIYYRPISELIFLMSPT